MIRKLRQKFVIVTMLLMTVTFGGFFIADNLATKYWEEQERLYEQEWYEKNAAFENEPAAMDMPDEFHMPEEKKGASRIMGEVLLVCAGFIAMLFVSLLLSRFVTEPAKQALEREKQFISDASHELKTPLAAISVNAQALRTSLADDKNLQNILSETRRMDALLQKLLKLSYLEEYGRNVEKRLFSLSRCCEEMALSMESIAYERKIDFQYRIQDGVNYCGNEDDIQQVIAILLDNAMKNTPQEGRVFFRLEGNNYSVSEIVVENSGQGILPEDLPHIFERFYRADKSRNTDSNSYGLGLAIAKAILDSHDATIKAESEYQKGVRFTVRL